MATRVEIVSQIAARLQEKTGGQKPCALCGNTNWAVQDRFATIAVGDDPRAIGFGPKIMPSIAVVCGNCGNTHLVNLMVLGFTDLAALVLDDDELPPK